jgi:hypothetical protein
MWLETSNPSHNKMPKDEIKNLTMVLNILESMDCKCGCKEKVKGLLDYVIENEPIRAVKKPKLDNNTDK